MQTALSTADHIRVTTTKDPQGTEPASPGDTTRRRFSGLPTAGERLLPWLGAAVVVAACNLVAVSLGLSLSVNEWAALLLPLGATLAAAGLVAARSRRAAEANDRDERARPALEQLLALADDGPEADLDVPVYPGGMEAWTAALVELLDHATELATDDETRVALAAGAEDTRALRELLGASTQRDLTLNESAMLHSVCSLWETDQERLEALAAGVDPRWHRRWRARSVVARRLRHGRRRVPDLVLPYRS